MRKPSHTLRPQRPGALRGPWLVILGSLGLLAILLALMYWRPMGRGVAAGGEPLRVYCAASQKVPVDEVARQYERENAVPVQLVYGGSETLLAGIELSGRGDIYIPADDSYLEIARKKHLVADVIPITRMTAVIAVRQGNPKGIHALNDLLRPDVVLVQANPDMAAIGKLTRAMLEKAGRWDEFRKHTKVLKPTVNDVANDLTVGTVDAGIVWDATVRQYPKLEMVRVPELDSVTAHVSVGVLRTSTQPEAARRFGAYLADPDKGLRVFVKNGFEPAH
jgi:molybdate transport system substrate-binding protein